MRKFIRDLLPPTIATTIACAITAFSTANHERERIRAEAVSLGYAQWTYKTNAVGVLVQDGFRWLPRKEAGR